MFLQHQFDFLCFVNAVNMVNSLHLLKVKYNCTCYQHFKSNIFFSSDFIVDNNILFCKKNVVLIASASS